jgi:hypothetical protein
MAHFFGNDGNGGRKTESRRFANQATVNPNPLFPAILGFHRTRGGLTKVVEAVRQLRGEAHPKVQVRNCDVALAHGTGGSLATRHGSATLIMGRE